MERKTKMNLNLAFRKFEDGDSDFVLSTWANSQSCVSPNNRCRKGEFIRMHKHFIRSRLHLFNIVIACNQECSDQIYGFIVYSKNCVHFIYVKSTYQKMRVASSLMSHCFGFIPPEYYSSFSSNPDSKRYINREDMKFNPFLLILIGEENVL